VRHAPGTKCSGVSPIGQGLAGASWKVVIPHVVARTLRATESDVHADETDVAYRFQCIGAHFAAEYGALNRRHCTKQNTSAVAI